MKAMILLTTISILGFSSMVFSQDIASQGKVSSNVVTTTNSPRADFDKTVCDLGELVQNTPGTAVFTLSNSGKEPLIISSASASCGCTNLTYSKDPILPGKSTTISVTYNAAAPGNFMKTVTVRTNAGDQPVVLQVKGKVLPKS